MADDYKAYVPPLRRPGGKDIHEKTVSSIHQCGYTSLLTTGVTFWNTPFCVTLLQRLMCYNTGGASKTDVTVLRSETPEAKKTREENQPHKETDCPDRIPVHADEHAPRDGRNGR